MKAIPARFRKFVEAQLGGIFNAQLARFSVDFAKRHGMPPNVSQAALVRKYQSWVYVCANINAAAIASTPLRLYAARAQGQQKARFPEFYKTRDASKQQTEWIRSKGNLQRLQQVAGAQDFEEILNHPLLDLLSDVNQYNNGYENSELTSIMLDLTGNSYWLIVNDSLGVPSQLWLLRSQWMRVVPDKQTFIKGYLYGMPNDTKNLVQLKPDEVIHFKCPNPNSEYYGAGPVEAASWAVQRQNAMDRYESSNLQNQGRPDLAVTYEDGRLDPKTRKETEMEWNNAYKGPNKAGKIRVMDHRFKIDKLSFSPREMEFLKGRPWTMKEISAAFNVPANMLDQTDSKKAGNDAAETWHAKFGVLPRLTRIEQKLNERLTPRYSDRLFLAYDNPVPADKAFVLKKQAEYLKSLVITVNEVRNAEGLPSVPWGDVPIAPLNVAPLGSAPSDDKTQNDKNLKRLSGATTFDGFPGGDSFDGGMLHGDLTGVPVEVN